jgi:hypothetical protein
MKTAVLLVGLLLSLGSHANAELIYPDRVPIGRILRNAETYLRHHPEDAMGWYVLGRIHYIAFVNEAPEAAVYSNRRSGEDDKKRTPREAPPSLAIDLAQRFRIPEAQREESIRITLEKWNLPNEDAIPNDGLRTSARFYREASAEEKRLREINWKPKPELFPAEAAAHANRALTSFNKAIEIDPTNALTHHTRACLLRSFREWLPHSKLKKVPELLQSVGDGDVRNGFLTAWRLTIKKDLKETEHPWPEPFLAAESGRAWVELCNKAKGGLSGEEQKMTAIVKASLRQLAAKPPASTISPVIFSLEPEQPASIRQLLAPQTCVSFDLRGRGAAEIWSWLKPQTCLLVWDPDNTGRITSGRQLFGNASFQLVFRDGFEALRLLDDNGDGILKDCELNGLSVWRDRDQNGISLPSEVVTVKDAGIASIAVNAFFKEDNLHPINPRGLTLCDGSTRPVWDWFAVPAKKAGQFVASGPEKQ